MDLTPKLARKIRKLGIKLKKTKSNIPFWMVNFLIETERGKICDLEYETLKYILEKAEKINSTKFFAKKLIENLEIIKTSSQKEYSNP